MIAGRVESGLDVFLAGESRRCRGQRVGLLANQASIDRSLRNAVDLFAGSGDIDLRALFGPEHGFRSGAQDMVGVSGERDRSSGLEVHSLYGDSAASLTPTPAMLEGIDLLVADLQDVGARYYTFAATIALALDAMAERGGRLILLDRPNPLGGAVVEGPGIAQSMHSFVGHFEVPVRHGMTTGELLREHAQAAGLTGSLEVVPMRGWSRSMRFDETGLPWVPPSPNMPTLDTAFVYPGACLIEGTNLSEGRGTTRPFEWIGAPFLDGSDMARVLAEAGLPGVAFRPITFVPAFHKWAGRACGGVALHVLDRESFRPVETGVAVLSAARQLAPRDFAWRTEPYEFVTDRLAIDLLTGSPAVREGIEAGRGLEAIVASWRVDESEWRGTRERSLLYT